MRINLMFQSKKREFIRKDNQKYKTNLRQLLENIYLNLKNHFKRNQRNNSLKENIIIENTLITIIKKDTIQDMETMDIITTITTQDMEAVDIITCIELNK